MAADEAERAVRAHRSSYSLFIAIMKWGAILALLTTLVVVLIISN